MNNVSLQDYRAVLDLFSLYLHVVHEQLDQWKCWMSVFTHARLCEQTEPDMNVSSNQTALRRGFLLFETVLMIKPKPFTKPSGCQSFRASRVLPNMPFSRHGLISLALMSKTLFNIQKGIISILKSEAVSVQGLDQQHILIHVTCCKL